MIGLWLIVIILVIAGVVAFFVWLYVRICHKAGRSGWWVLLMFVPLVNAVFIWIFAFARWPGVQPRLAAPGEADSGGERNLKPHATLDRFEELEKLREEKLISDEEYAEKRKAILDRL